ncbi:hypothetical protein GJ496_006244 [Pomphorhynchus laevis]|nr:hypothetical protein GJ496_006244 [Pomphorhynchus laevis]
MCADRRWVATNFSISQLSNDGSDFVKPYSINFTYLNGKRIRWDAVNVHDSVAIILYHVKRNSIVLVRQFRPVVFVKMVHEKAEDSLTYELCAGILDKPGLSKAEVAKAELREECGYDVPVDRLLEITTFRGSVGISGSTLTLFYAEIDDSMKINEGGGNIEENENIEVVECPVDKIKDLFYDDTKQKPPSVMCSLLWFLYEREAFLKEKGYNPLT